MKEKTARRFLTRNRWKIAIQKADKGDKWRPKGFIKTCIKVLRSGSDMASRKVHNKIIYR